MTAISPDGSIPYASPAPRHGARAWAGAAIVFAGMVLILLGGCFLIGVLMIVQPAAGFGGPAPTGMTGPQGVLMVVLYALAFASFAGAAVLIVIGTRGLLRVLRG